MTGVPDPWLSTLREGLKAEDEDIEGWLAWETDRTKKSPVRRNKIIPLAGYLSIMIIAKFKPYYYYVLLIASHLPYGDQNMC